MNLGWLFRAMAGLLVLFALVACSGGSPTRGHEAADMKTGAAGAPESLGQPAPQAPPPSVERDVVKTASMTITVPDPSTAADQAATTATDAGGRVDSRTEYGGSVGDRARVTLTLRVPADKLDGVIGDLKGLGTVKTLDLRVEDVTSQRVDLDARIKALQTSVDRLLGIVREATNAEALIQAEGALSQRQADLDSLRAQRTALGDQIAYSTITVEVVAGQAGGPAPPQYQGFFGQVERGWDALVATGSNLLLLAGLLLPWAGAGIVLAGLLFGLYRLANRRR